MLFKDLNTNMAKSRAYCGGTFDLLHPGHIAFLKWAKTAFGTVIVSLNRTDFVARYKTPPVQSFVERKVMLEACKYVDFVVENSGDEDSKPSILLYGATHIVDGSDWTIDRLKVQMMLTDAFLVEHGLEIVICPIQRTGFSTTELKNRIRQ